MPRDITHIILADEAAEKIKSQDILDHPEAFHMGCLAVDSFLYSSSPKLSSKLHGHLKKDTRAIVLEMLKQLKNEKNPVRASEQKAFIYGYLCHMAADIAFHPLVYSISGSHFESNHPSKSDIELSKASHRYAETWLDLYLMKDKKLSFKNFRPFRKIVTKLGMRMRLDDFFTDACQNVLKAKKYTWGDNFDLQAQFHFSMLRQLFINKITQNQSVGKILRKTDEFLHGKLKLYTSGFYNLGKDIPQCLTVNSFTHPATGEVIHKSIKDLELDAVKDSVKFIQAADDYIKSEDQNAFLSTVPNFNLDSGTEGQIIRKKPTQEAFEAIQGKNKESKYTQNNRNFLNALINRFCKNQHK